MSSQSLYFAKLKALKQAGLLVGNRGYFMAPTSQTAPQIVEAILTFMAKTRTNHNRTYMAMYDIASNKVRRLVAKYFEEKGFIRIQKSVYLASLSQRHYKSITTDISEMNAMYENEDSLIFIPINDAVLAESRFIGKALDFQLALNPPSSLVV